MSQPPPSWPPQGQGNPFSDQPPGPYGPGGPYPGAPFPGGAYPGPPPNIADDPAMRWVLPVGQSPWAIVAGYCGLFSLLCAPLGVLGIIFGVIAIVHLQRNPRVSGWGRAITGIVLGLLTSALAIYLLIILSYADR